MQFIMWGLIAAVGLGVLGTFVLSLTAGKPDNLGPHDGELAALPDSPNCVSTQTDKGEQWMEPLTFEGEADGVVSEIRSVVESMSRSTVIESTDIYLHAEFRSAFFRFVDDVEFLVEPDTSRIHFRSASRVGHSDFGVNRSRMHEFRRRFEAARSKGNRKSSGADSKNQSDA